VSSRNDLLVRHGLKQKTYITLILFKPLKTDLDVVITRKTSMKLRASAIDEGGLVGVWEDIMVNCTSTIKIQAKLNGACKSLNSDIRRVFGDLVF
jgi:hypothetical protein